METVWDRFQATNPRKGCTVMDDDMGKLRQPLISSGSEDESDCSEEKDEIDGLLPHRPQFVEGVAARRQRLRRKDEEDLGEMSKNFAISVKPLKLLHSVGGWMLSLSTVCNLLLSRSTSPSQVSLSMQQVAHRRKFERMDEVSDRALVLLAIVTLSFCFVLLLAVYMQAA